MTMSPIIYLLGLIVLAVPVALVALRPAYPHSRIVTALWVIGLAVAVGFWLWTYFIAPPSFAVWRAPDWYPFLVGAVMVVIPFATSHLLWRQRAKDPPALGPGTTTLICLVVCVTALVGMSTFNKSCVYFDYNHDGGTSWCPAEWQAQSRFKDS